MSVCIHCASLCTLLLFTHTYAYAHNHRDLLFSNWLLLFFAFFIFPNNLTCLFVVSIGIHSAKRKGSSAVLAVKGRKSRIVALSCDVGDLNENVRLVVAFFARWHSQILLFLSFAICYLLLHCNCFWLLFHDTSHCHRCRGIYWCA